MVNRRSVLLALLLAPLPLTAALAQPWWDERRRREEWLRYQDEHRRRASDRHQVWDERREHGVWERRRRDEARLEWERQHGPYRP